MQAKSHKHFPEMCRPRAAPGKCLWAEPSQEAWLPRWWRAPALGLARALALGRVHLPLRKLAARRCLCAAGLDGLRAVTSRAKENKGKARPKLKFQTQIFSSKLYESERKRSTREKETAMRSNRLKRSLQKK